MTDPQQPIATLYPQVLTVTALDGAPVVLVDDPNYLVDDPRAFIGSQTTEIEDIKVNTHTNVPKIDVQRQR